VKNKRQQTEADELLKR